MAEALLRHHLRADPTMPVASVGTIGWNGYPATPHAVEVLAERGIDLALTSAARSIATMSRDPT
jgi:protein-tyrosine-phosphatase